MHGPGLRVFDLLVEGELRVDPIPGLLLVLATDAAGTVDLATAIPADPGLAGVSLWLQVFTPGPGLSNGLGVTVGG